jgi:arylsulfatase A-like enzyme
LYWEFFEKGGRRAIRTGDFKFIQYGLMKRPQPIEIYNVAKDLDESEDLASARPDLVQRARDLFRTAHARSPIEKWNFPAKK